MPEKWPVQEYHELQGPSLNMRPEKTELCKGIFGDKVCSEQRNWYLKLKKTKAMGRRLILITVQRDA